MPGWPFDQQEGNTRVWGSGRTHQTKSSWVRPLWSGFLTLTISDPVAQARGLQRGQSEPRRSGVNPGTTSLPGQDAGRVMLFLLLGAELDDHGSQHCLRPKIVRGAHGSGLFVDVLLDRAHVVRELDGPAGAYSRGWGTNFLPDAGDFLGMFLPF